MVGGQDPAVDQDQNGRPDGAPTCAQPLMGHAVYGPVTVLSGPAGDGRAIKEAPGSLRTA